MRGLEVVRGSGGGVGEWRWYEGGGGGVRGDVV